MNSELFVPYKNAIILQWSGITFYKNTDNITKVLKQIYEKHPDKDEIIRRTKSEQAPGDSWFYLADSEELLKRLREIFSEIGEETGSEMEETPLAMSLEIFKNSSEQYVLRFLPVYNLWNFYLYKYEFYPNGKKMVEERRIPLGAVGDGSEDEKELAEDLDILYITDAINDIYKSHGMGAVFE